MPAHIRNAGHTGRFLRSDGGKVSREAAAAGLASGWFASWGKGPYPTVDELETRCPGFSGTDYAEAVGKNVTWARK